MRTGLLVLGALVAIALPAAGQIATFSEGAPTHLDPIARQSTGNRMLEQLLGNDAMEPVVELAPSDIIRKLASPVGRLTVMFKAGTTAPGESGAYCTASLIDRDLILTNHHCVPGRGNVEQVLLTLGYLKPRSRSGVAQYPVHVAPVEASEALDYAILRVDGNPGVEWGVVALTASTPDALNSLFLIHHPGGYPQYVTRGRCQTSDPAVDGTDLLHTCDTIGGSSGAPIFDNNTRLVVGLHYSGVAMKKLNAGKRIASIAEASPIIAGILKQTATAAASAQKKEADEVKSLRERLAALETQMKQATPPPPASPSQAPGQGAPNAPTPAPKQRPSTTSTGGDVSFTHAMRDPPASPPPQAQGTQGTPNKQKPSTNSTGSGSFVPLIPDSPQPRAPGTQGATNAPTPGPKQKPSTNSTGSGSFVPLIPDSPQPPARCAAVEAVVAGQGKRCLDPADAKNREFQDCTAGLCSPTMVVLPTGSYRRGSEANADAKPVREVRIGYHLAVGKFEVTFDEWDACVADGGCKYKPNDEGWGRGKRPVIKVSWNDITGQYLPWLNRKLSLPGQDAYRLLTEAEWEYAARAGTTTGYAFGDTISISQAQFAEGTRGTVEVGSFKANAFGLHDLHGNVWEWVKDCYVDNYRNAPTDGAAVADKQDCKRVIRGGAWDNRSSALRAAGRYGSEPDRQINDRGFRVGRVLSAPRTR